MSDYIKVEGHPNLVRDKKSGVILNINKTELEANRIRKQKQREKDNEIEQLKNDVSEIKSMLNKLVEKL
jgi:hypothetical protein